MSKYSLSIFLLIIICSCKKEAEAPVPDTYWDLFQSAAARPMLYAARSKMEGVYALTEGHDMFGSLAAVKWSYTKEGNDSLFHLSFFCEQDAAWFICGGKRLDSSILLNGFWRKMSGTGTGKVRFSIGYGDGAGWILGLLPTATGAITLKGVYGSGAANPDQPITLMYQRPLYNARPFERLAHRGGGRNADVLPASENSVEMIRMASRFGATGVEIDVRLTSDGVPILFHDATLNERVVVNNGMLGPVTNYSYAQLYTLARLPNGERIPTLRQALETILYQTPIRFVWLDTKIQGPLDKLRAIQLEFMQAAAAAGRNLEIVIGIPDDVVLKNFRLLPDYQNIPSLCELTQEDVAAANAKYWAPTWTQGLQNEAVQAMQAQGKKVFVWTLDVPENIEQYLNEGKFNGILSNYPSVVAFYYYAKQ